MRCILAGIVLILMLTGGAAAGPHEDGVAAHERGDYATALRLWRPLAEQGKANAQYNLGVMYDKGQGVTQDYVQAHKRKPAEAGLVHT
jgi:TPR repeat protein